MMAIALTGDENATVASGYVLAGLLRSHKSAYHDIPATTDYYLKSLETESLSMEFIVSQLFERGICGFAVQTFLELAYSDYGVNQLTFAETTELIASTDITPLQAETLIAHRQDVQIKAREIMETMNKQNLMPEEVLARIAFGQGKNAEHGYCFARIVFKRCVCPDRTSCMHCDYEILTTSMISRLLSEREDIALRLAQGESDVAQARDGYLMNKNTAKLIEICATAEQQSSDDRTDMIGRLMERRLQ